MATSLPSLNDNPPLVSFVIPCYNLAHYLGECLDSIISQNYCNIELIIMDDCSPDKTSDVVAQYTDRRIRYVKNKSNLGHLRNYNAGLSLALGKYIWLISADDVLQRSYIVERYVKFMEDQPGAGFMFCPGVSLNSVGEKKLIGYSVHGDADKLFQGACMFKCLLKSNSILAASGLVRKSLYQSLGMFPQNMPFAGDWYLWLLFSLHSNVGYLAESMVVYRDHGLSMTNQLQQKRAHLCAEDDVRALWQIRFRANEAGQSALADLALVASVDRAALLLVPDLCQSSGSAYSVTDFERFVRSQSAAERESITFRHMAYSRSADRSFWHCDFDMAKTLYRLSLRLNPFQPKVAFQYLLIVFGRPGTLLRKAQFTCRRWIATTFA